MKGEQRRRLKRNKGEKPVSLCSFQTVTYSVELDLAGKSETRNGCNSTMMVKYLRKTWKSKEA